METAKSEFLHADVTERVLSIFYDVYNELGHGFLESVYQKAMTIALTASNLAVQNEVAVPVWFRGQPVGDFRADLIVGGVVLLELKSGRSLETTHEAQTLNYLRATDIEVALLLNFGPEPQFRRLAFSNQRKKISVYPRSSAARAL